MKTRWKILIAIGLGVLASYVFGATPDHRPTEGRLKNAFLGLNETHFYGGIPNVTKIRIADLTEDDQMGYHEQLEDGSWIIFIDQKSHPVEKEAEMTLIHEMCHIYLEIQKTDQGPDGHNESFQACMVRVAVKGAFKDLW